MENQRLILFVALSLVLLLMYNQWQVQFSPTPMPTALPQASLPNQDAIPIAPDNADTPSITTPGEPVVSTLSPTSPAVSPVDSGLDPAAIPATVAASLERKRIHVKTDLLEVEIDSKGGDIQRVALLHYPLKVEQTDNPIVLFNDKLPNVMINQSGLLSKTGAKVTHHTDYLVTQTDYVLGEGQQEVVVELRWASADGWQVVKSLVFTRDSYVIEVKYRIENNSGHDWTGSLYRQIQRNKPNESENSKFIYTYTGAVVSSKEEKYEKIQFDDMAEWRAPQGYTQGGWAAMIQHYFIGALIPNQDEFNNYYTKVVDNERYIVGVRTGDFTVAAASTVEVGSKLYIGPKDQNRLEAAAPELRLTVDYGVLTILAQPLFWLLGKLHDWVQNWGVAIILVTLIVKLLFFKLSEAAYRSMANMRKFQPKIVALRERYGNDKQRMSQAMMDLYKKEKINPLGGCLPMLVQIPVFLALYWVLLESVELRQADFIFWIHDLSAKDPFYVLPVIMGISMFLQQKLNPTPMDPMQQKILQFLPLIFTVFFAFFPSGLVLYWVVNNILSILQQWYITRKIETAASA